MIRRTNDEFGEEVGRLGVYRGYGGDVLAWGWLYLCGMDAVATKDEFGSGVWVWETVEMGGVEKWVDFGIISAKGTGELEGVIGWGNFKGKWMSCEEDVFFI